MRFEELSIDDLHNVATAELELDAHMAAQVVDPGSAA